MVKETNGSAAKTATDLILPTGSAPQETAIHLSEEQEYAIKLIIMRRNVYLAGPSFSGKNTTFNIAASYLRADGIRTAQCSLAALAADRIDGTSFHRFFKLPLSLIKDGDLVTPDITKLMEVDVLFVNYCMQCTPPLIDIIWKAIQMAKDRGHHVQVVFSGDPLGLCSVMDYKLQQQYEELIGYPIRSFSPLLSQHWEDFEFETVFLSKDMWHADTAFGLALEEIRIGSVQGLNRLIPLLSKAPIPNAVWVYNSRAAAQKKNEELTASFPGEPHEFLASSSGDLTDFEKPSPFRLVLKEHMPVFITANIPGKRLTSGMRGIVSSIKGRRVYITVPGRKGRILIDEYTWQAENGATYTQLPLVEGFATTAFKARYMKLNGANVEDILFQEGGLYTVASRVPGPDKLFYQKIGCGQNLKVNREIYKWYKTNANDNARGSYAMYSFMSPIPYRSRDGMRFSLMTYEPSSDLRCTFVCLRKQDTGQVCGVVDLYPYLKPAKKVRSLYSDIGDNAYYVIMFLNYAFIDGPDPVDSIENITGDTIQGFLNAYALGMYGRRDASHTSGTVERCISVVTRFLQNLLMDPNLNMAFSGSDLFVERYAWSGKKGLYLKKELAFDVIYDVEEHVTIRDMPPAVVQEMLTLAYKSYPDILMNLALGLCAGLRPSETCALSLDLFTVVKSAGKIIDVIIDLEHTVPLREDGVDTGEVKKPRKARVQPMFIPLFEALYTRYMEWRQAQKADSRYRPLCLDSRGQAMTYDTFRRRFKELLDEVEKKLRDSMDPSVQWFLAEYRRFGCSCHILRHIYTVNLVLAGYDVAAVMNARGDKSPLSAQHYLNNKGILLHKTNTVVTTLFECILRAANEFFGRKRNGR